ncbi:hypothetical protein DERP_011731 [Dermatophagoides pteronyssinus]|uniref:Uncharacterized protein n=1 Tax=Dermatophagoides pteronyssinus TaxID=6956 RepID=A0ABQ8J3C2_DERPT|nr:hypothetical protein DERP_011731 [Dermatophagoides pteronyssinus]
MLYIKPLKKNIRKSINYRLIESNCTLPFGAGFGGTGYGTTFASFFPFKRNASLLLILSIFTDTRTEGIFNISNGRYEMIFSSRNAADAIGNCNSSGPIPTNIHVPPGFDANIIKRKFTPTPEHSNAISEPILLKQLLMICIFSCSVFVRLISTVSSAPNSLANSKRFSLISVITTRCAPKAFTTCNTNKPIGPAPKLHSPHGIVGSIATLSPGFKCETFSPHRTISATVS